MQTPDEGKHPHGTFARYNKLGCRCAECRAANTAFARWMKANRIERGMDGRRVRHGTHSTYVNWKCRCARCSEAQRVYNAKAWRRRRKRKGPRS